MSTIIVMPQLGESVAEGIIGKWLKNEGDASSGMSRSSRSSPTRSMPKFRPRWRECCNGSPSRKARRWPWGRKSPSSVTARSHAAPAHRSGSRRPRASPAGTSTASRSAAPVGSSGNGHCRQFGVPAAGRIACCRAGGRARTSACDRLPWSASGRTTRNRSLDGPGTGIGGRVSKHDIMSHLIEIHVGGRQRGRRREPTRRRHRPMACPVPTPAACRRCHSRHSTARDPTTDLPVSPIRKIIADRMVLSKTTIPHATTIVEVDMTNVVRYRESKKDEFRRRENIALSYVAFVIKATVEALKEYPDVNSEWARRSHLAQGRHQHQCRGRCAGWPHHAGDPSRG